MYFYMTAMTKDNQIFQRIVTSVVINMMNFKPSFTNFTIKAFINKIGKCKFSIIDFPSSIIKTLFATKIYTRLFPIFNFKCRIASRTNFFNEDFRLKRIEAFTRTKFIYDVVRIKIKRIFAILAYSSMFRQPGTIRAYFRTKTSLLSRSGIGFMTKVTNFFHNSRIYENAL